MSEKLYKEIWTMLNNKVEGEKATILDLTKSLALLSYDEGEEYNTYFLKKLHLHGTRLTEAEKTLEEFEATVKDPTV